MPASLCINLFSETKSEAKEIIFFEAEVWTPEVEKQLINKMQELFATVRKFSTSFMVSISIETSDIKEAGFLLDKKINSHPDIISQKLSLREVEILSLIMQGLTNNEIAQKLFISYETVKSHRKNILEKTNAKNTAALINYYHQTFFDK
jgi:DNA-binding CsgD family transcriptional regulator